ncbi:hypothetical protein [Nostoc sp. 'Peltigera membranacea cyanobiont' N6]|uniref:hypothetical protein n=1 Tax=Nostoc sp. 'Peltigera membranacea cyanobiont' N6 TaxID=1261031 RepID=UPI000CF31E2A|nr:hypothetical protein [Nostoc sp. 'Peltigera membranacea cyanobiont' N6]
MFGSANNSDTIPPLNTIMACLIAIKIAPNIDESSLVPYLQCVDDLNRLLLEYQESQDKIEKNKIEINIRNLGESLDQIGGHKLMELTCNYLTPNYNLANKTERIWAGIGGHWYP